MDAEERAVVTAFYRVRGVLAVRRTVRDLPGGTKRRFFYVEVEPGAEVTAAVADPHFTVLTRGEQWGPDVQAALEESEPLWVRPPWPERGRTLFGQELMSPNAAMEWWQWSEQSWAERTAVHRLLLRLSPALPGPVISELRYLLAWEHPLEPVVGGIGDAARIFDVALLPPEADLLRGLAVGLSRIRVVDEPPAVDETRFVPAPPGGWDYDHGLAVKLLVMQAAGQPGVDGLWLAWHQGTGDEPGCAVFTFVLDPGLAAWDVAANALRSIGSLSGAYPRFEVVWVGDGLVPEWNRAAIGASELLWHRLAEDSPNTGGIRTAPVFDHVSEDGRPWFRADHEVLDDPDECVRLARRMLAGTVVVPNPYTIPDVLVPSRGRPVPLSYRTDGQWIWRETSAYYLAEHRIAPQADLLAHLRALEAGVVDAGD